MFWADRLAGEITERYGKGKEILIRDEKTPSGRVHVGSMRGVAIHGAIAEALTEQGVGNTFNYEFNDMDPMDGFPEYLPEDFRQYMGQPLRNIPSPDGKAKNFAEYFAEEFKEVITKTGFTPTFYNVSELYFAGKMDEVIRIALDHAADIRRIYKEVSGSQKPEDWFPLAVICEQCGKVGTTRVFAWDGSEVSYKCEPTMVKWAQGCSHEGKVSPFGGKAKFPFKVEWPAKWKVVGVMVEGAGKDHSTKGGARDVAAHIAKEIFEYDAPMDAPYEFFLVGGKKMSSSKGRGSSAKEISELVPAKIFRLALMGKEINQAFNFDPEGDTIPVLYDQYDKLAAGYWTDTKDDYARLFELIHPDRKIPAQSVLPRFSQVAFMVQMPHMDLYTSFPDAEKAELDERAMYAKRWLEQYAPEKFVFKLQESTPEAARSLNDTQKAALRELLSFIEIAPAMPGGEELHKKLHDIKETQKITPAELFGAIYRSFLDKTSGPQAGWFLSSLKKEFVVQRLKDVTQ
ncbi:MAG: lysine--tRNA ligase [Candidatus Pacebacteria bacterium]|nr:lysine--tRNA ligase [Candidatus Paceibacterota bacterium]